MPRWPIAVRTVRREAACPGCGTVSARVHAGYRRRLADLAVAGGRVVIDLAVRRFRCPAAECGRRTFVEQVDGLTERFARSTSSLRRTLEKIALALAGHPAARLTRAPVDPSQRELLAQAGHQLCRSGDFGSSPYPPVALSTWRYFLWNSRPSLQVCTIEGRFATAVRPAAGRAR